MCFVPPPYQLRQRYEKNVGGHMDIVTFSQGTPRRSVIAMDIGFRSDIMTNSACLM